MASLIYNRFKANLMNKEVDLEADVIKCALVTSSYTADATHVSYSSIDNEVPGASGYTTGGSALAGKAVTEGATTKFDATDCVWSSATFTARAAVLWDDSLTIDDLIAYIDFGQDYSPSNGTFTIVWDSDGIITLA